MTLARGNVKNLVATFLEKQHAEKSSGLKDKDKTLKKSQLSGSLSARSESSIEDPLDFKGTRDFRLKKLKSDASGSLSANSEHSIEHPLAFKGKRSGSPDCDYSLYETESDWSKDIPLHFSNKTSEKPDCDSSLYETESALSKEIPLHFSDKKSKVRNPPPAAYHVVKTDHRAPHDIVHSAKRDYPEIAESICSSDTSDFSSLISQDSQSSSDTVSQNDCQGDLMCDICNQNAAEKICQTCNNFFCMHHALQHGTMLQKHILKDIGNEVQDRRCLHQMSKDYYCRNDQMHICSICVEGNHKRHDTVLQKARRQVHVGEDFGEHDAVVPPPGEIKFLKVKPTSVVLTWGHPQELNVTKKFKVKWSTLTEAQGSLVIQDLNKVEINNLQLGEQYFFSVATEDENGNLSKWVKARVSTAVPPPQHLKKDYSEPSTLSLTWSEGENMEGIPHQFLITVTSPFKDPFVIYTKDCHKTLSDLEPDTEYNISVSTLLDDKTSDPVSISVHTVWEVSWLNWTSLVASLH
ncbi:hypothetical protein AMECASPLE_028231 [Ameca splendens]|uniref:Fibronectin type-III domain-containing protein n=1 Tax=Ameca splendens TaxID=208324 RepID=A0ABV0ZR75_9TELE